MLPVMHGLHLTADLRDCAEQGAVDWPLAALRRLCLDAVRTAGLQPVGDVFHAFDTAGQGVTGVVLLAESHLAVHTWPELRSATADVYVCNFGQDNTQRALALMATLEAAFAAGRVQRHQLTRGEPPRSVAATPLPTVSPSTNASSNTE